MNIGRSEGDDRVGERQQRTVLRTWDLGQVGGAETLRRGPETELRTMGGSQGRDRRKRTEDEVEIEKWNED
jgi:hypothetical protein